jgi:hypothetical protein
MPDGRRFLHQRPHGEQGFWAIDVVEGKPGIPRLLKMV